MAVTLTVTLQRVDQTTAGPLEMSDAAFTAANMTAATTAESKAMVDELSRILADPSVPGRIPPESIPPLMAQLAALQSALAARLISGQSNSNGNSEGDRLLGIQEAAQKIGVTEDWLYRRTDKLPFVVRLGRNVRFSERGIEKYIRLRMGR